jgi:ubiquinone/menaquinone biosynthesis C-methylase UbiE
MCEISENGLKIFYFFELERENMNNAPQSKIWTSKTYDQLARIYDLMMKVFFPAGEIGRRKIVSKVANGSILDVACGTGTLLAMAGKKGLSCYGVDLSRGMLDRARKKAPGAELKVASFYSIPYDDGTFDYVVETNALSGEFIDERKAIQEMIRVCKRGGEIYLADGPKTKDKNILDKLMTKLGRLNEDLGKDYLRIFGELGYHPEVNVIDERYHIYCLKKK